MVTGGWITQADRARWQQRAAAELAAILAAHPDLPVIAWTVTASGGALSGQVLAPAAGRRGLFGQWRQALGLDEVTETPSADRDGLFTCTPAASAAASRSASPRPSSTARRTAGERPRRPGCRGGRAVPGSCRPAGEADGRGAPGVPGRGAGLRPADPVFGGGVVPGGRLRAAVPRSRDLCGVTRRRWQQAGRPDLAEFPAADRRPDWAGHRLPSGRCRSPAAGTALRGAGCASVTPAVGKAGRPGSAGWLGRRASRPAAPAGRRACLISYCDRVGACRDRRSAGPTTAAGDGTAGPDPAQFAAARAGTPCSGCERDRPVRRCPGS